MKILTASILIGQGPDRVFLNTDMPSSFAMYSEPLMIQFEAERGTGAEYVRNNFGLEPTIIHRSARSQA
jgi:hypothetical protein